MPTEVDRCAGEGDGQSWEAEHLYPKSCHEHYLYPGPLLSVGTACMIKVCPLSPELLHGRKMGILIGVWVLMPWDHGPIALSRVAAHSGAGRGRPE